MESEKTAAITAEQKLKVLNRAVEIAAEVLESDSRRMSIVCRTQMEILEMDWHQLADTARCLIAASNYLRNRHKMIEEGEKQVMQKTPLPIMPGDSHNGIIRP